MKVAKPPKKKTTNGYDPSRSFLLATCCARVYSPDDGKLLTPPLDQYRRIGTLWLREFFLIAWAKKLLLLLIRPFSFARTVNFLVAWDFEFRTPFGVVLESKQDVIVAFRGTHDSEDVVSDLLFRQRALPGAWTEGHPQLAHVRAHSGFVDRAEKLRGQLEQAVAALDRAKPCYVTGHSLGGAVAILANLILKYRGFRDLRLYTYAGPRVGNPAFAKLYDQALPASYRVVNDADLVPQVPLRSMLGESFVHVGQKWGFLNQSEDLLGNHGIDKPNNYLAAAQDKIPSDKPWNFPVSAAKPDGTKARSESSKGRKKKR